MKGDISAHMVVGRSNMGGPVIGGYMCIPMIQSLNDVPISQPDQEIRVLRMPFDFRLNSVSYHCPDGGNATVANMEISHNSATTIDGNETALLSSAVDIGTTRQGTLKGSSITTSTEDRDIAQGRYIILHVTTDGTGTTVELSVWLHGHAYGFPVYDTDQN